MNGEIAINDIMNLAAADTDGDGMITHDEAIVVMDTDGPDGELSEAESHVKKDAFNPYLYVGLSEAFKVTESKEEKPAYSEEIQSLVSIADQVFRSPSIFASI